MRVHSPHPHIERDYKGSLATVIAPLFYPKGNDTLAPIAYLSTFAAGFVVRPFGALSAASATSSAASTSSS